MNLKQSNKEKAQKNEQIQKTINRLYNRTE